jgi:FkbM family methyltransferase
MLGSLHRVLLAARGRLRRFLLRVLARPVGRSDLERLGSIYGGWVVPVSLLSRSSICYSIGVGEDISFDVALIERFDCKVFAFDPTPRAIEYARRRATGLSGFQFYPWGVWSRDARLRFYAPSDPRHVSHSAVNLYATSTFFEAECRSLASLMREFGHSQLDLLKLDIEGAEYEVLRNIIVEEKIPITVIAVEFHEPSPLRRVLAAVRELGRAGYELVSVDGWNCTFVAKAPVPGFSRYGANNRGPRGSLSALS